MHPSRRSDVPPKRDADGPRTWLLGVATSYEAGHRSATTTTKTQCWAAGPAWHARTSGYPVLRSDDVVATTLQDAAGQSADMPYPWSRKKVQILGHTYRIYCLSC